MPGLLDDCSRYIVASWRTTTEREADMLELFVAALRRHRRRVFPGALYLDNGSFRFNQARRGPPDRPRAARHQPPARPAL